MRKVLTHLLASAGTRVPAERIYQTGAVDSHPTTPFIVYRLSGTDALPWRGLRRRPTRLEVWVHDKPGSYLSIDEDLDKIEDALESVVHAEHAGEVLSQVDFGTRSPDLFDQGFQTIMRMSQFTIIGRG